MKCRCNLFLDQCMWSGQCGVKIENYGEYFDGLVELQTKNPWIMRPLDDYFERIVNPTVAKYERKETKMTRDEALEKINAPVYAEKLVSALEALGLIKFEENLTIEEILAKWMGPSFEPGRHFEAFLNKHGYKIVKK